MTPTYNDFLKAAQGSGLMGQFSREDLATAQKYPEFGLSILSLKKDYQGAGSDEQRLLINTAANELRRSYANYSGGPDGSQYISGGKIPGQIDTVLDKIGSFGPFDYQQDAPVYENKYAKQQQELLDAILDRPEFSWSKETDPQWAPYKKEYLREGDRATQNALAQASAASGGRPSSFAMTAAGQAGDYYATKLSDIIPTLYQQAYDRYLNEYQMKLSDLGAVNSQEQLDYARYLDQLGQFNTDRNFAYNKYLGEFSQLQDTLSALQGQDSVDYARLLDQLSLMDQREQRDYERAWNEDERGYQRGLTAEQMAYQKEQEQQALARAQIDAMLAAGGSPSDALLGGSGYTSEYVQALEDAWKRQEAEKKAAASPGGGSGGSGGGYNNGSRTPQEIMRMQTALGVEADGKWGPATQKAAGGLSADEAWAIMSGGNTGSTTPAGPVKTEAKTTPPAPTTQKATSGMVRPSEMGTKALWLYGQIALQGKFNPGFGSTLADDIEKSLKNRTISEAEAETLLTLMGY